MHLWQGAGKSLYDTEKFAGHFRNWQTEEVFDLRKCDEHSNAISESYDDRVGHKSNQYTKLGHTHDDQNDARHHRADHQVRPAVFAEDRIEHDDERARWATDAESRATKRGNDQASDDGCN